MAFKIIREFVAKPLLMITCDHPNGCDRWASVTIERGHEESNEAQVAALSAFKGSGWSIGFSHRCPEHMVIERANRTNLVLPDLGILGRVS